MGAFSKNVNMASFLQLELVDDAADLWEQFKLNKLKDGTNYLIFTMDDWKEPQAIKFAAKGSGGFEELTDVLPEKEARYVVYNLQYEKEGAPRNKIAFIVWAPEASPVKHRMIIASQKETMKGLL